MNKKNIKSYKDAPKYIKNFIEAVYPETVNDVDVCAGTLACYIFNERRCLIDATKTINDLRKQTEAYVDIG